MMGTISTITIALMLMEQAGEENVPALKGAGTTHDSPQQYVCHTGIRGADSGNQSRKRS